MSLLRTVYLGAIICGWMAFGGWFAAEILRQSVMMSASENNKTIAAFCLVGAAIGAGLGLAGGLSNWQLRPQLVRMLRGFGAGSLGGVLGAWLGDMIYSAGTQWWLRPVGWMAAGALVGLADGLFTLSRNRIRNGLIGGLVGGLIGGILFDPIKALVARAVGDPTLQFEITSRAAGFVAVGLCIGAAVGLTHLLLRHAWLTVLDGDRPGRQVILTESGLTLGSDPSAGLPFLRDADRTLLPTHLRIVRGRDGSFSLLPASPDADAEVTVMKNGDRETYSLKDQKAKGINLKNDCVINCGRNAIRFNEKSHRGEVAEPSAATATAAPPPPVPNPLPKPPPPKPDWRTPSQQPVKPDVAQAPVSQPPARPEPPPAKKTEPAATPASRQPISQPVEATSAPTPKIAPPPVPQPSPQPQPQPTPRAENVCPNGHKVPTGQRYCLLCDIDF